MKHTQRCLILGIAIAAVVPSIVSAQAPAKPGNYPARPVRMIVAYPPGGGADVVARMVAQKLSERIGVQVVVENRPGAAGNIGVEAAARSPNDGYTLLLGATGSHAVAMSYYAKINYDLRTDFTPISMVGTATNVVVIHPALPVKNVKELIALAKARPGELNFASSGTGGLIHLTGEMFKLAAKINIVHVPYKGTQLFLPDLLNGQVAMALDPLPPHLPFVRAGRLRAIAVTASRRSPLLPDVPTMAEAALPGFESFVSYALLAPAGLSKDITSYLSRETNTILLTADFKERLTATAIDPAGSTPEELDRIIRVEIAKWARVIKEAGITPE